MKKNIKLLAKGIVCIVLALSMTVSMLSLVISAEDGAETDGTQTSDTVDVVILVNNVSSGKKIKSSDVEVKTMKNVNIPKNIISNADQVVGKYSKAVLYAGEYVYAAQLSDKPVSQYNYELLNQAVSKSTESFVDVTDYVPANTGEDLTAILQKIIDNNARRTIYFPDGEYIITSPLKTCGAAINTVSLLLSDGAVIKAHPDKWSAKDGYRAMICLGAADRKLEANNDVISTGSYYSLQGGTIDCSGVAEGVNLAGGRETLVKNVVIKNTSLGIELELGTNNNSSDMDVDDVTIIGNGKVNSKGISIIGLDNTFSNIRIYNVQTGIDITSEGNSFHNIQIYNTMGSSEFAYDSTVGINAPYVGNFYYHCYVENFATAYKLKGTMEVIDSCRARWTSDQCKKQTAVKFEGELNSVLVNFRADFFDAEGKQTSFVSVQKWKGHIQGPILNDNLCTDKTYRNLLRGDIIPIV